MSTDHNQTPEQRVESASADLWGCYIGQPDALPREFNAWLSGYRDIGADALIEILTERIREEFDSAAERLADDEAELSELLGGEDDEEPL